MKVSLWRSVIVAGVVVTTAGCASRTSLRFVTKGDGFVDVGGPIGDQSPAIPAAEWDRARREAIAARAAKKTAGPRSIEETDPELREALSALTAGRTVRRHVAVATQYSRLGVRDMAYDHYSKALALDARSLAALDGRARLLRDVGLMNMALADAHRARYVAPKSAAARNTLGTILERLGQCREAAAVYREAADLSEDAEWARSNADRVSAQCPG